MDGDLVVQSIPLVIPAGSPTQTFEVDFSLATVFQGPLGAAGWLGPGYVGARMFSEGSAAGVTFKLRSATVRVAQPATGPALGPPGTVKTGERRHGRVRRPSPGAGSRSDGGVILPPEPQYVNAR